MPKTVEREDIAIQIPKTVTELVLVLNTHLPSLNYDFFEAREKPPLMEGKMCVPSFLRALRERNFTNLAEALAVVYGEELRREKGKNFPTTAITQALQLNTYSRAIQDLSFVVSQNASLLKEPAKRKVGEYGVGINIGALVLTYYDLALFSLKNKSGMDLADLRRDTLVNQDGFVPSPMMRG